jgi:hypothetical protein
VPVSLLCAIRGCRIHGRHLPDCDGEQCTGCLPRAADEGHVCGRCEVLAMVRLDAIAEHAPDARLVAAGLVRRGSGTSGGKPGSRPPLNDGATDALHAIQARLVVLMREIAEERGLLLPGAAGAHDPIVIATRWLTGQLPWLRHAVDEQGEPRAVTVFAEIGECLWRIRSLLNGPGDQKFYGPCGSTVTWDDDGNEVPRETPCDGDVQARPGAEDATCRACGVRWKTAPRQAWLDGEVRQRAYRASEIEDAYGVKANLIRQWATTERGLLRVHDRDFLGRARYMLGEVLDLARDQKLKAAARAADRERRAAARAAEGVTA